MENRELDLIKKVRGEIVDFYTKRIPITVAPAEEQGRREFTYDYSQRETVALIDLYWNSQFRLRKVRQQNGVRDIPECRQVPH